MIHFCLESYPLDRLECEEAFGDMSSRWRPG